MRAHEDVLVFAAKAPAFNPQKTGDHKPMAAYYTAHNGENYGSGERMTGGGATTRFPRTVQQFPIINNDDPDKFHPTQKPVDLVAYFIRTYSAPGDLVMDNTAGSATTAIAAHREGRRWLCIEKDEGYFAKALTRLETHGIQRQQVTA